MAVAGIVSIKKGNKIEGAMWYGKVCTFGTYVILITLLLFPNLKLTFVNILVFVNMVIMVFTLVNYIFYYHRIFKSFHVETNGNMETFS